MFFSEDRFSPMVRKKTVILLIVGTLLLPHAAFPEDAPSPRVGQAASEGKTSAAAVAWAVIGIGFLIAIGTVIAVTLAKDHK